MIEFDYLPIFAFLCGVWLTLLYFWQVKRKALSISRDLAGIKGRQAKEAQGERLMAFMLEVKTAYDGFKAEGRTDLKEFGMKRLPAIALKYPDVLLKQGKNLMKLLEGQGLADLGGLF